MSESRPTPSERLSKILTRGRTRGLSEASRSLGGELRSAIRSSGTLEFLVRDTDMTCPDREDLAFRAANFADAAAYAAQIGTDSIATFRARLSDTTRCYLVETGGQIAHASWMTTSGAWTTELGSLVTPPAGSAYVYESFTDPALRGRGIYPFALSCICAELSSQGITEVWIGVEATNAPSVRAITKAGFKPAFSLDFRKRWRKLEVDAARGPRAETAGAMIHRLA